MPAVSFIVNDDVALALKIEADGIHLGQDDMAITTFRTFVSNKIVGVSVHTMSELKQGLIFPTKFNPDAKRSAGFHFFKQLDMRIQTFRFLNWWNRRV